MKLNTRQQKFVKSEKSKVICLFFGQEVQIFALLEPFLNYLQGIITKN